VALNSARVVPALQRDIIAQNAIVRWFPGSSNYLLSRERKKERERERERERGYICSESSSSGIIIPSIILSIEFYDRTRENRETKKQSFVDGSQDSSNAKNSRLMEHIG
jgi:hypothetical protein